MAKQLASGMLLQRGLVGAIMATAAMLVASPAAAELDLRWEAPARCPTGPDVLRRLEGLGVSLSRVASDISVAGTIAETREGFVLTVRVRDGADQRQRVIENESCAELANAAAVTLALLLNLEMVATPDPLDGESGSGEGSPTSPTPPPAPLEAPRATKSGEAAPSHHRPRPLKLSLLAPELFASSGPFNEPELGAGIALGARVGGWELSLGASAFLPTRLMVAPERGDWGAEVQRISAELLACYSLTLGLELGPCAGIKVQRLRATGVGDGVSPRDQTLVWPTAAVGLVARWPLATRLAFSTLVSGDLHVVQPRLTVRGLGEVQQVAVISATGTLRVEWIF